MQSSFVVALLFARSAHSCPAGYTFCAKEHETCHFGDEVYSTKVAYGLGVTYAFKEATVSIACSNSVFGDPVPGTPKECCWQSDPDATMPPVIYDYVGCFGDSSPRALPVGFGYGYDADTCSMACNSYQFFSLQNNGQCWCGDSWEEATQYGYSNACPSSRVGAAWANDLYRNCDNDCAYEDGPWNDPIPTPEPFVEDPSAYFVLNHEQKFDFMAADQFCQTMGRRLATIRGEVDRDITKEMCSSIVGGGCYIGLYQETDGNDAPFYWVDGHPLNAYGFHFGEPASGDPWNSGEPNNGGGSENCVQIGGAGAGYDWNDIGCSVEQFAMCGPGPYSIVHTVTPEPTPGEYRHLGCYADSDSHYRALTRGPMDYGYDADSCSIACAKYKYFGLQDGGMCFCEKDLAKATIFGASDKCGKGYEEGLGGSFANDLYEHDPEYGEPVPVPFEFTVDPAEPYFVYPKPMDFNYAEALCGIYDRHLVSLHYAEQRDVTRQLCIDSQPASYGCWMGLFRNDEYNHRCSRCNEQGEWLWTDGTDTDYGFDEQGTANGQDPWFPGEPNDSGGEDCVHFFDGQNYHWNDIKCEREMFPLCGEGPDSVPIDVPELECRYDSDCEGYTVKCQYNKCEETRGGGKGSGGDGSKRGGKGGRDGSEPDELFVDEVRMANKVGGVTAMDMMMLSALVVAAVLAAYQCVNRNEYQKINQAVPEPECV